MNLDAITTVNDSLQQIQEVTYSWDDDGLGDEDVYKACDELRSVCVYILTTLDELLDEDEDGDGDSEDGIFDEEFVEESVIAETAGEKAARTAREHADSILDHVGRQMKSAPPKSARFQIKGRVINMTIIIINWS
ncbi:hypothetical protein PILCRDRAFT_15357 [Piloderma croceum F 1598]|uniref:Uncharacterized protein n=1 Tax=Piloderma croceum (strain F 1598) TaxID=765440 RepID=A0A0C3B7G7_PILCF|nr:hypothetical protein PILCRDRAFT_15357 [Piloderma croceum F 1598]